RGAALHRRVGSLRTAAVARRRGVHRSRDDRREPREDHRRAARARARRRRSASGDERRAPRARGSMTMAALYPVFLKPDGQPVLVVGGGTVAAGKLDGLIAAGAYVTLVAPQISQAVRAQSRHVRFVEREFRDSDLDGARWVVAAATPEVNRAVSAAATARK